MLKTRVKSPFAPRKGLFFRGAKDDTETGTMLSECIDLKAQLLDKSSLEHQMGDLHVIPIRRLPRILNGVAPHPSPGLMKS
jgi:hypothetical protein